MTAFIIENPRWPGLRYQNGQQEAPDADTAIAQFLEPRTTPEQRAGLRRYSLDDRFPLNCNVVYRIDPDAERLVAVFTIPAGEWAADRVEPELENP
jgi:hypothetical protein